MLSDNGNGIVMPVAPMNGYGNGGFGNFGGDGGWWFILLLFAMMGGFGNSLGGYGGGAAPYINNDVQRGFDQNAVMSGINGLNNAVTAGFGNVQTSLCNGFAGVNQGVANGFAQAEIAANGRQMANMQQMYGLSSQFADCCCENRLAVANLGAQIAQDGAATRANTDTKVQMVMDKLCQLELDGVKGQLAQAQRENVDLQNQLNMANLAASQNAQTAQILANNEAQTSALEQYLAPVPRPAYIVQNPNGCNCAANYGCCGVA